MTGATAPVVLWDVDDVLNPTAPTEQHVGHFYSGRGPTGEHAEGTVYLNPQHGEWLAELTAAGASHAWATSWGALAADWIAPRIDYRPAQDWPIIDVGVHGGVRWGHTNKLPPVSAYLSADQPAFWIDDLFGGKDPGWAEDRTAAGVLTVLCHITHPAGLQRADIDAALDWLATLRTISSG